MRLYPLGESTVVLNFADEVSAETTLTVTRYARCLTDLAKDVPGIEEVQPTYTSVAVHFDPGRASASYVRALMRKTLDFLDSTCADGSSGPEETRREPTEIPVLYGGEAGPDLASSAAELGMEPAELARRHAAGEYLVHMLGFLPGFPYLGVLDPSISLPRLKTPRTLVPAGSVGIAVRQTGIYSVPAPGGWRIIGRTPLRVFAPDRERPFLFEPGMRVRFRPVGEEEFNAIASSAGEVRSQPQDRRAGRRQSPSVPALRVEDPGFFSTVQDLGRKGFRRYGVPLSGAADRSSLRLGNALVGNPPDAAGVEITYSGAMFTALMDVGVAVTGAPCEITVNGTPVLPAAPVLLRESSVLRIGPAERGARTYLCVAGGIEVPPVLGSRSTCVKASFGGYCGRPLRPGDILEVGPHSSNPPAAAESTGALTFPDARGEVLVRVFAGPEAEPALLREFSLRRYTVAPSSDRMGLRLDGEPLGAENTDIVSDAVVPGVVQLGSNGLPMVILVDGQTTGGYRRIAVVISEDIPLLGQVRPGSSLRFVPVTS